MTKKRSFDANSIKLISFILSSVIILVINLLCTALLLRNTNSVTKEVYFENCKITAEGYQEAIEAKVEVYKQSIDALYVPDAFKKFSTQDFVNFLSHYKNKFNENFKTFYYVDKQGIAYFIDGTSTDVSHREVYKKIIHEGYYEYLNEPVMALHPETPEDKELPIIIFGRAVYDDNNNTKGIICGSIRLSNLTDVISTIEIGNEVTVCIQNEKGNFISHPKKELINKHYNPSNLDFSATSFDLDMLETFSPSGEEIYILPRHIQGTNWTLIVSIPKRILSQIKNNQLQYQILMILISVCSIILILIIETRITRTLQKKLLLSSSIDSITGFHTRDYFEKEASKILYKNRDCKFLLIESDIRSFKYLTEKEGEHGATKVLVHFAKLLNQISQRHNGLTCRGYVDIFYSFYKIDSVASAMKKFSQELEDLQKITSSYAIPYNTKFGLAFYLPNKANHSVSIKKLIDQATLARNTTKNDFLKTWAIYNNNIISDDMQRTFIESHMNKALENHEFFVMYQPKMDLKTDKICGAEALVRWKNEEFGVMSPDSFIPVFEQNNFIIKLDFYVYEEVFKFIKHCKDNNLQVVPISLNMSRNHDKPEKFIHTLKQLMAKYEIEPNLIEIEMLERSNQSDNLLRSFTLALQKEGLKVAIDDFGSGESSLNMLSNIPVDILKYDRSFLLDENQKNAVLTEEKTKFIETLVNLGKSLNKKTIFEGVETKEQLIFLKSIGCAQIQGYYYSKPLSQDDFTKFLEK